MEFKSPQADQKTQARKSLGQHFLRDGNAIAKIVRSVPKQAQVLEIGPGLGAITEHLLDRAHGLTVIEKDDRFAASWQQQADKKKHLTVVHGDVLEVLEDTIVETQPEWIVGNLPYNISGPLTAQLASHLLTGGMVLMYQREVAERIIANPGSKVYGGLSVLVRHFYNAKRLLSLPPGAFSPPPKVHSTVVLLQPHNIPPACTFQTLQRTVRQGFAHRRKTINNNFRGQLSAEHFANLGINPSHRPEQLDYAAWAKLALFLSDKTAHTTK